MHFLSKIKGNKVLVLSRREGQSIIINNNISITLVNSKDGKCDIAISAPKHMTVHRKEIQDLINKQSLSDTNNKTRIFEKCRKLSSRKKQSVVGQ